MKREILVDDGIGGEHVIKYIDEERVVVQKVMRLEESLRNEKEEVIYYSIPARVSLSDLATRPYTESLKKQIVDFHDQCLMFSEEY